MFDALEYSHKLEEAGFTKKQAERSVKLLMEILKENLASKIDLKEVKTSLQTEIKEVKTSLQNEIQEVKTSLQTEIKEVKTSLQKEIQEVKNEMNVRFIQMDHKIDSLESRLLYKLGALMIVVQGAFVALAKFI